MLQILRWQSGAYSTARDIDQQPDNSKQQAIASVDGKEASGRKSALNTKATADRTAAADADTVSGTPASGVADLITSAATEQGSGAGTADTRCTDSGSGASGTSEITNLADGNTATSSHTSSKAAAAGSSKPMLVLALQHADQEPAAFAILQALYAVKLVPELLSDLPQKQQLHASLLADMWQIQAVDTEAV